MKLNLDAVLINPDGSPAMEGDRAITIRQTLINAVLAQTDGDMQPVRGEDKVKRYAIYMQLKNATIDTEFEVEDVAVLRKAVLIFPTIVVGQVREVLK